MAERSVWSNDETQNGSKYVLETPQQKKAPACIPEMDTMLCVEAWLCSCFEARTLSHRTCVEAFHLHDA